MKAAPAETGKECFAPLPFRALTDSKLTRADLATLGMIAAHDRFSANRRGCEVGRRRLAYLVGCDLATLSRSVGMLIELEYITADQHRLDRRRRVYRIIYTDADSALLSRSENPTPEQVTGKSPNSPEIGAPQTILSSEIGDLQKCEPNEIADESENKIFCETGKIFPERDNKFGKIRVIREKLPPSKSSNHRSVESFACEIERRWKQGELSAVAAVKKIEAQLGETNDRKSIAHLERIVEDIAHADSPSND